MSITFNETTINEVIYNNTNLYSIIYNGTEVFVNNNVTPITYTVTFNMDNHGTQIPNEEVICGHALTRPNDPVDEDYDFINWYSDSNYKTLYNFATILTDDITIYGKWIKGWGAIIKEINNGTFNEEIGFKMPITDSRRGTYNMILIAKNTDILADNSGYAATTWCSEPVFNDSTLTSGYLPSAVQNNIKSVKKITTNRGSTITSNYTVFNFSVYEVFGSTNLIDYGETSGCHYTFFDNVSNRRKKTIDNLSTPWYLRTSGLNMYNGSATAGYRQASITTAGSLQDSHIGSPEDSGAFYRTHGQVYGFCI